MARVTARAAYTRAKSKRQKGRVQIDRSMLEARRRYIRQLAGVGIAVDGASTLSQSNSYSQTPKGPNRRPSLQEQMQGKKITDYFAKTKSLDFSPRVKQPLKTSITYEPNGVECVTIYDSDADTCDNNNTEINPNTAGAPGANAFSKSLSNESGGSDSNSFWNTTSESDTQSTSYAQHDPTDEDIKPTIAKLDISDLGVSFEDLKLRIRLDEDVEIVDILPPIPLRKHEVYDLDVDDECAQDMTAEYD